MHWIQNKIPDLPISNFTNDWNDGRAVGALVDAVAPGLCPDWPSWDPKDALQNASEAMGLADDWLNVRQLLKPEDLVNPAIDEQSMMTYLSQYPNAKLKPGAPVRPRANPNRYVKDFLRSFQNIKLNLCSHVFCVYVFKKSSKNEEIRLMHLGKSIEVCLNFECHY